MVKFMKKLLSDEDLEKAINKYASLLDAYYSECDNKKVDLIKVKKLKHKIDNFSEYIEDLRKK